MSSISKGELFVGLINDQIMADMIINHESEDEVMGIHALGVHPRYSGHSYAKKLVRFAIEYAKQNHQKAIRLDFLKGNIPAERLYSSMGFKYLHTLQMYY